MRIRAYIAFCLSIVLCACHPDQISDQRTKMPEKFNARIDDVVDCHGPWQDGECLYVYGNSEVCAYRYTDKEETFSLSGKSDGSAQSDGRCYVLSGQILDSDPATGTFAVKIPQTQVNRGKYVDPKAHVMAAVPDDLAGNMLGLHSAVGFLKVKVFGHSRIRTVTVVGKNKELLSGTAVLKVGRSSATTLEMDPDAGKSVTVQAPEEGVVPAENGADFFFCLPPVTFSAGLTVVIRTDDGNFSLEETNPVIISRGRLTTINQTGAGTTFTKLGLQIPSGQVFYSNDVMGPEITVCVPKGTSLKSMTPVFEHTGATVEMFGKPIISGKTAANFSSPLTMTVFSTDEESSMYTIKVVEYDLPVVYVSTPDHTPIVDRDNWIAESSFIIQQTDGTLVDYGYASIKGRGNASWSRPKKSYSIKLAVKPKELGVLGLPGHKRWCMIAVQWGYLGNSIGYELARRAESYAWQPHGRHVEFVLNGTHIGTYVLAEQIRIDKNRVDIKSLKPEDIGEDKISGGYLLTYDRTFNDPNKFKSKYFNMPVMIKDPDDDDLVPAQFTWIQNYINEMEAAMSDDTRFARRDYLNYLDIDTYIDMWFVWELAGKTGSHDGADFAHPNSVWFFKDRGGKLKAGPCWDFDSYLFSNQKLLCNEGQYYGRLFQDPAFRARVKEKWPVFRASVEGKGRYKTPITEFIDSCYNHVKYSAARNQKMWTWTMYKLDTEYKTIRSGLPAKMDWLEKQINAL